MWSATISQADNVNSPGPNPNPYQSPEPVEQRKQDWTTWNPFQSEIARTIATNLTESEKRQMTKRSGLWGFWTIVGLSAPMGFLGAGFTVGRVNWLVMTPCFALIIAYLLSVRPFWRRQRELLADTEWARENGIQADEIKLTRWF